MSVEEAKRKWENTTLKNSVKDAQERQKEFRNLSNIKISVIYTPVDLPDYDYTKKLGTPGEFPFTRGLHEEMYRKRLWTMRQFAGFGTAEETNLRFKYLLEQGESGLSIAFDTPTLYGLDSDDAESLGEVGKCGVAVSSVADMQTLFDGIPMGKVSTSMTINSPAAIIWAFYIVTAESQGFDRTILEGTIQNDILKEYIAQKEFLYPPEPSMRLVTDTIEFGTKELPRWNPISISGYHIREAGATAVQELAFTLANGMEYVRWAINRGLNVDDFAQRLSFFFNAHNDFFEEIAKYRAARRIWATVMKETFNAKKPRSWWLRFHTQTAGCSLTAQEPENNIIRTTIQALAAVLGGTQSLHTNSMDEALALPTEQAVKIALRTQQIIAYESGVPNTVDPLGGSYYVEWLTDKMEEEVYKYFSRIEALGGVIPAIEKGFFQKEIADSAARYQREIESQERIIVGVNRFRPVEPLKIPILKIDETIERKQCARLKMFRENRDAKKVEVLLRKIEKTAEGNENLMPSIIDASKKHATLGEICKTLRTVFGSYREKPVI